MDFRKRQTLCSRDDDNKDEDNNDYDNNNKNTHKLSVSYEIQRFYENITMFLTILISVKSCNIRPRVIKCTIVVPSHYINTQVKLY